jgi:1-pyrroline-5-carboxylate dehydrogenase
LDKTHFKIATKNKTMSNAFYRAPKAVNEPVLTYTPESNERAVLKKTIAQLKSQNLDIPMYINGKQVFTENKISIHPPHERSYTLGYFNKGTQQHVLEAIQAALDAKTVWENMAWVERAAIFLKAADLLSGPYRAKMNAATMLCQSKNVFQSEIDAVAELCDFFRFNVEYLTEIYQQQPYSPNGTWNRLEYRALEGFIFALTPFNFTSIAGNLPAAPALCGNTVVWKPADSQVYSAAVIMEILELAGMPAGVINLIYVDGPEAGEVIFNHRDFAGLHFTGSTKVFQSLWATIGNNLPNYKTFPRIVGETGGKDFVVVHPSSPVQEVVTALTRGAFEFQGQKCSAASRAYLPKSRWDEIRAGLAKNITSFKIGSPENFTNFINAVIDERAFDKIADYIAQAKEAQDAEVILGGRYDKSIGYFIEPTVILAKTPNYRTMEEEIFGPVLTVYVYEDNDYAQLLDIVNETSPYALTGAIFAKNRSAIQLAMFKLRHAAGNFYINDKPTGAVVGQQPFGGARSSGTNDKAGSILNLYRWLSPRTIKETFVPPTSYEYPFMNAL